MRILNHTGWIRGIRPGLTLAMPAILCVCLILVIYWQTAHFDYVRLDDYALFRDNPHVHSLSGDNLRWMLISGAEANWIPLSYFVYAVGYVIWGSTPGLFHLMNVFWHVVATFSLYLLIREILREMTTSAVPVFPWAVWMAVMLWATHPTRVESVAWISEIKDVLFGTFYFLSLYFYVRYLGSKTQVKEIKHRKSLNHLMLCFFCFVLSVLSKPMAVSLPLVLFVFDYFWRRPLSRRVFSEKLIFIVVSTYASLMTLSVSMNDAVGFERLPLDIRLWNAIASLGWHLEKLLLPFGLSPIYHYESHTASHFPYVIVAAFSTASVMVVMGVFGGRVLRSSLLYFLITMLPVLGFTQVGSQETADRFSYVTVIPAYVILAYGLCRFMSADWPVFRHAFFKGLLMALAIVWVFTQTYLSWRLTGIWKNTATLLLHQANHRPSADALISIGDTLYGVKNYPRALAYYRQGSLLFPLEPAFRLGMARCYKAMGNELAAQIMLRRVLSMQNDQAAP